MDVLIDFGYALQIIFCKSMKKIYRYLAHFRHFVSGGKQQVKPNTNIGCPNQQLKPFDLKEIMFIPICKIRWNINQHIHGMQMYAQLD